MTKKKESFMNNLKKLFSLYLAIFSINSMTTENQPAHADKLLKPSVKLLSITPDAEKTIAYIARVSNPANQDNENFKGLLKYCIKHHHWSVFEQAFMTLEIETSRAICMQILRHRSFTFQQFSQRYADNTLLASEIPLPELRAQDFKNRQNSIDSLSDEEKDAWYAKMEILFAQTMNLYQQMLAAGIAKECARFILPEVMPARLYMSGTIRSWIHYIELRSANGTQKEHQEVALLCKEIFIQQLPTIAQALGWL
jgi:thymidylate synthase (FAD)